MYKSINACFFWMVFWNMPRLEGILFNFFVSSSIDLYKVRQRKKHQYLTSYQSCLLRISCQCLVCHQSSKSTFSANKVTMYGRAPEQGRMVLDRWQPPKWCHVCYLLSPLPCPASLSQDWLYPHLCLFTFFISSSLPSCKAISCICQSCCMDF